MDMMTLTPLTTTVTTVMTVMRKRRTSKKTAPQWKMVTTTMTTIASGHPKQQPQPQQRQRWHPRLLLCLCGGVDSLRQSIFASPAQRTTATPTKK